MDNEAPPSNEISDEQWKVVYVLQMCSASLSVIGSSAIVFKILRVWILNGSATPYDRIMLGLSSYDILSSVTQAINQFLYPSEMGTPWAFGSMTTCRAAGFLYQLSVTAVWYNCILSYFFLLTVLSQLRRKDFVRKCEPWMHLSGIFFPITAIIGLRRGWFAQVYLGKLLCWISDPVPKWIVAGIPTIFTYLSLIINYGIIYGVVRKSLRSADHGAGPTSVQKRIKSEAATLMFLYIGFFLVSVSPNFILEIMYIYIGYDKGVTYPVRVVNSILLPLQGFFNVFIYLKPAYTRFRAANPNKPIYFILHQALFNPKTPRMHYPSDQQASNAVAEGDPGIDLDIDSMDIDSLFQDGRSRGRSQGRGV